MTDADAPFDRNILDNLLDGVVIVGLDGVLRTVNPAAAAMFGLEPEAVAGRTFVEVFIAIEGFDEFTQTVLDAVADRTEEGRRVIGVRLGDEDRSLTVTISYMEAPDGAASVIVVLSDITEIRELRESQLRMAQAIEEQNAELQQAYRDVEKTNEELTSTLKKVQLARVLATVVVIVLFLGVGGWGWGVSGLFDDSDDPDPLPAAEAGVPGEVRTVTVRPRAFDATVSLIGRLAPWRQVQVVAPIAGHVREVLFDYGQQVAEGDRLVTLDTAALRLEYQQSEVDYRKAQNALRDIDNWENGAEVSNALRSYTKAKMALDQQDHKLRTSAFLLKEGLISVEEHEDLKLRHENQLLDFEAIEQDLAAARARGGAEARRVAQLEYDKAENRFRTLERQLKIDKVTAPIGGVARPPGRLAAGLAPGQELKQGDALLRIADFTRMSVEAQVDEVEVSTIQVGQPVTVTGDAFPGLQIPGAISQVSAQAVKASGRGPARFAIVATLEPLEDEHKRLVRAGMSARMRIVTYSNPSALMVPLDAVEGGGDGKAWLRVRDAATGEIEEREVRVGLTTQRSVEVTGGLESGAEVVLPSSADG